MTKRKSLSKKVRFEVFKRDSFTCQYCGSKAPKVILEVDHIIPVSKGGKNDLLNLTTSCFDCNRGKSDRKLTDGSVVEKQRLQIEELNIKRQQLEMMLEWRDGVIEIKDVEYNKAVDYFNNLWETFTLNESGQKTIKSIVKKHGLINVLDCIDKSFDKYGYLGEDDGFELTLKKVSMFLNIKNQPEHKTKINYIKGIVRNKYYINEKTATEQLNEYYENGFCLDELKHLLVKDAFSNWSGFISYVEDKNVEASSYGL